MTRQVLKKWGNSPAVRIPAAVMEAAHLSLNQPVEVKVEDGRVIIEPASPSYALDDLCWPASPRKTTMRRWTLAYPKAASCFDARSLYFVHEFLSDV